MDPSAQKKQDHSTVEERILSHRQLGTESPVAESEQDSEHGTGLEHAQGLGRNASDCNKSNENYWESQDLNQDQGKKSNE